jgi:hypothetical protein
MSMSYAIDSGYEKAKSSHALGAAVDDAGGEIFSDDKDEVLQQQMKAEDVDGDAGDINSSDSDEEDEDPQLYTISLYDGSTSTPACCHLLDKVEKKLRDIYSTLICHTMDDVCRRGGQMDPHTWTPRPPRYLEVSTPSAPLRHAPCPRLDPHESMRPPSTTERRRSVT